MNKKMIAVGILALSIVCSACGGNQKENKSENKTENKENVVENVSADEQEEIYEALFDVNNKVSIKIDISEEEIAKIEQDYEEYSTRYLKSPIYRRADKVTFTIGDKSYEIQDVGIRMKGNTSRTDFYSEEKGVYNLIHFKLSFDEAFDNKDYYGDDAIEWKSEEERMARKARTFANLDALEVKWNKNYDNAYVRQYYSYDMFRNFGVIAPQNTFAQVMFGDENYGVYLISEPVDKKFIERNLPEKDWGGDLYKAGWTFSPANYTKNMTYGVDDVDAGLQYNLDLKTNKSTSNHEKLENLLDKLNGSDMTKESFSEIVDIDNWTNFTAVSYFLGNPDDFRNNYNNHYIYFLKSSGKAIFIPYDYDRTLGITHSYNPEATGMTEVSPFSENAEGSGRKQNNPLYLYSILDGGFFVEEYKAALDKVASSDWMQPKRLEELFETVKTNYEDVAVPDREFENVEPDRLKFSLDGEFNYGDDDNNMAASDYMERILATYNSVIAQ